MADVAECDVAAPDLRVDLALGAYRARIDRTPELQADALQLRGQSFRQGRMDADAFDAVSWHGTVTGPHRQNLVAFRLRIVSAARLSSTYTGQAYDLSPLTKRHQRFLELGRFCHANGAIDTTAIRLAWAAIGTLVDAYDVHMLIGCSSFPGVDPACHSACFATLYRHHLGPADLRPRARSPDAIALSESAAPDVALPPLLRAYLGMGGWVGDQLVIDPDLKTQHVFTGMEVAAIPEPRKARLRALALAAQGDPAGPLDLTGPAP
ncbi:GNAT family N-acetyltransferase [Marivita sp. S6314]|uniref:GNAT family N-acetyltransferase n=1 Tax=Marivita sp. S6314 TaxID=2926406 RepID=UPI001FF229D1|nr:GNAT family N-acyltransferase [Marivita sp. S6314]MCK0148454.1 GNAT family N-acetyltransferase [Marivita sp. S6314]